MDRHCWGISLTAHAVPVQSALASSGAPEVNWTGTAGTFPCWANWTGTAGAFPSRRDVVPVQSVYAVPVQSAIRLRGACPIRDIPQGAARGLEHGIEVADYTQWTSAADLKNLRYYFRTFDNSRIRMVDLNAVNFGAKEIRTISIKGDEQFEDVTSTGK